VKALVRLVVLSSLALMCGCGIAFAATPTPPLGWNSYDAYGTTVDEPQFRANALWMSRHLKRFGWHYVIIDMQWYVRNPTPPGNAPDAIVTLDAFGRYTPALNRFPSAANGAGFAPLAAYAHSLGLGFGIHILRGIPREAVKRNLPIANSDYRAANAVDGNAKCPWNPDNEGLDAGKPAAQTYYNSIAALYASWGVDFIKADCLASKPYSGNDIRMLRGALQASGRDMLLSVSPGPAPIEALPELRRYADLWRISNDVWDLWNSSGDYPKGLADIFALAAMWAPEARIGAWPDADMLAIGYLGPAPGWGAARNSRLSAAEQRTLLTLWCISRSPLMIGANLTRMDAATRELLINPEVLAVDQRSSAARVVHRDGDVVVWLATPSVGATARANAGTDGGTNAGHYVAVFNVGEAAQSLDLPWPQIGIDTPVAALRDLWLRKDLQPQSQLRVNLSPHASALYRVSAQQDPQAGGGP
jgi:alpha-galactosidase